MWSFIDPCSGPNRAIEKRFKERGVDCTFICNDINTTYTNCDTNIDALEPLANRHMREPENQSDYVFSAEFALNDQFLLTYLPRTKNILAILVQTDYDTRNNTQLRKKLIHHCFKGKVIEVKTNLPRNGVGELKWLVFVKSDRKLLKYYKPHKWSNLL